MPAPSRAIPRNVWMLGFVSLLMDTSSESIHALLPLYMVGTLGASTLLVGIVEGFAEATALVVKVFSGYWSDKTRRRKPLVLLGYGIAALSKFAFPLAPASISNGNPPLELPVLAVAALATPASPPPAVAALARVLLIKGLSFNALT